MVLMKAYIMKSKINKDIDKRIERLNNNLKQNVITDFTYGYNMGSLDTLKDIKNKLENL